MISGFPNTYPKNVSGVTIASVTRAAHINIVMSLALVLFLRTIQKGIATTSQAISTKENSIPTIANPGCMCIKLKPAICGPRVHVHTVFSHAIRAANSKPIGEQNSQTTFIQSGKLLRAEIALVTRFGMTEVYAALLYGYKIR